MAEQDSAVRKFFGRLGFIPDYVETRTLPMERTPAWPTQEQVQMARENDLSYGDKSAGMLVPGGMVSQFKDFPAMQRGFADRGVPKPSPLSAEDANDLKTEWLAAQQSALATLGFDPRNLATGVRALPRMDDLNLAGLYRANRDQMYSTGMYPSTVVHEAMHRGMKKLMAEGMMPDMKSGNAAQDERYRSVPEELKVRALMQKFYGPVEMSGDGDIGDQQVEQGGYLLRNYPDRLQMYEDAAAKLLAQQRPKGPR